MRLSHHTEPAQPGSTNLDAVEIGPSWVVVADGVTPKSEPSGCTHGTHWYTTTLVSAVAAMLGAETNRALPDLVREAIATVADSHGDSCDLGHPDHPSAMLAVLREHDSDLDYLVIGDVLVLIEVDDAVRSITDVRPDALPHFAPAFVQSRRNAPGGFVVAAGAPNVVDRAVYGTVPRAMVARAGVFTDGAARLADRFGQLDHPQLLDLTEFAGPARVVQRVRAAERDESPAELARRRGKQHDDATAVMVELLDLYSAGATRLLDRAAALTRRLREAMDLEVWCGMVAALARDYHALSDLGEPPGAALRYRRTADLLTLLARGVYAGAMGRPALPLSPWPSLAGVPKALELQYSARVTALSAARLRAIQGHLVEEFAEHVRADTDDVAVAVVIEQVAHTYMLAVRQPAHGRRPLSTGDESLLNRIAKQRARCTGEDPRAAAQRLAPVVRAFAPEQQEAVEAALTRGFETRLLGAGIQIVDERIREAVLPLASTPEQQRLEAEVLLTLGRVLTDPRGVRLVGRSVVPRIHLHADGTIDLHLRQSLGGVFLRALLPRVDGAQVIGAPGVRVRPMPIGVRLRLAHNSSASIHVFGIGEETLRKATADVAEQAGVLIDPGHTNRPLLDPERDAAANPHNADLSALLRRIHSIGEATRMTVTSDSHGVALSWRDGRDAPTVACALAHPLTGLSGDEFQVTGSPQPGERDTVSVHAASASAVFTLRRERGRAAAARKSTSPGAAAHLTPVRTK